MADDFDTPENSPQGRIHSKPEQDFNEIMRLFMKGELSGNDKLDVSAQANSPSGDSGIEAAASSIVSALHALTEAIRHGGVAPQASAGQAAEAGGEETPMGGAPLTRAERQARGRAANPGLQARRERMNPKPDPSAGFEVLPPRQEEGNMFPSPEEIEVPEIPPPPPPPASAWEESSVDIFGNRMPEWFGEDKMPHAMQETMGKADDYGTLIGHVEQKFEEERKFRRLLLHVLEKAIHDLYQDYDRLENIDRYFEGMRTTL